MDPHQKRKHKTLTLKTKCEILKRIDNGEKIIDLAKRYGLGRATVYDIRSNRSDIENFINTMDTRLGARKTIRRCEYAKLEEALHVWYLEETQRETIITRQVLRQKAIFLYQQIYNNSDFKASDGWLSKFKQRYGIRFTTIPELKRYKSQTPNLLFIGKFKQKIHNLGLTADQVYRLDERKLFWKLLPQSFKRFSENVKTHKEYLTFMLCTNVTGKHKLRLLAVGKSENPNSLKNITSLPVIYKHQKCASITTDIFRDWFENYFEPEIKHFMKKNNLTQKALLLLNKSTGYECDLQSKDGLIQVMFLPPHLKSLNDNICELVLTQYREKILLHTITQEYDFIEALKAINLKDVLFALADTWQNISVKSITLSWKNLWPLNIEIDNTEDILNSREIVPLSRIFQSIANVLHSDFSCDDLLDWLTGRYEKEAERMREDEILNMSNIEDSSSDSMDVEQSIKHEDALAAFNTCVKWAEENCINVEDVFNIRRLREESIKKSFSSSGSGLKLLLD